MEQIFADLFLAEMMWTQPGISYETQHIVILPR